MTCHICGKASKKLYSRAVYDFNHLIVAWTQVRECRYWHGNYKYCGAACSLIHHESGYQ